MFEWFENNLLKGNAEKCHLIVSSSDAVNLRVSECDIKNSECVKLLGVKFDKNLTFEKHITDICKNASRKNNIKKWKPENCPCRHSHKK